MCCSDVGEELSSSTPFHSIFMSDDAALLEIFLHPSILYDYSLCVARSLSSRVVRGEIRDPRLLWECIFSCIAFHSRGMFIESWLIGSMRRPFSGRARSWRSPMDEDITTNYRINSAHREPESHLFESRMEISRIWLKNKLDAALMSFIKLPPKKCLIK